MEIYSLHKINELSGGDPDFAKDIILAFLEEIPQDLDWLQKSFDKADVQEIYQASHKIKPNLDLVGSDESYTLVSELNRLAKQNEPISQIRPLYDEAMPIISQLLTALRQDFA